MFETLFGAEMPLAVRFFLAFLIVLGLIGATAWAVRRFGTGRLGNSSARGRQPRLAVIDYASVDSRRRLILVRRDNVEHLLMIGGPTDVVVEPNIVRAVAAPRDVPVTRAPAVEALPRAIPLPDNATNGSNGTWPLQPEPASPRLAPRPEPEEPAAIPLQPHAETPPGRPQRDTLSTLADELSARPLQPRRTPMGPRPKPADPRPEPRAPATPPAPPAAAEPAPPNDQSLADMAHRLEAALRKPSATADGRDGRPPAPPRPPAPLAEHAAPAEGSPPAPPRLPRAPEAKPARADAKPPGQGQALYDSLEQEMASLLGRPTNKP